MSEKDLDSGSVPVPVEGRRLATGGRLTPFDSLRFRLSLLITLLVAGVLAIFLVASNRAMRQATLRAGGERALAAATQIAGTVGQNTGRGFAEIQRVAQDPALREYLERPTDALRGAITAKLEPIASLGRAPVALLSSTGESRLVISIRGSEADAPQLPPAGGIPAKIGIGPIQREGEEFFADFSAEIHEDGANGTDEGATAGYLVVRRAIRPGPNLGPASRLIGAGAVVAIGNRGGALWSDLTRLLDPPALDTTRSSFTTWLAPNGESHTGGLAVVEGTPWAVWIELPERLILTSARTTLRRMIVFGVVSVALAAVAGVWLSGYIVRPLDELTHASEAIAAGATDARVGTERRDEIGRLARAFNVMSDRVAEARRELEARVRRRTKRLEDARTELHQRVEELQDTRRALEERAGELSALNRELESFSYSVSHDLRAPVRHIHGFVGLLQQSAAGKLSPEEERWLATIANSSSRMGRLIDDLLELSRTNRAALALQTVDLDRIVAAARHDVAGDPNYARVHWTLAPLPAVVGDPSLLHQVFVNLLSNAVKYTRRADAPSIAVEPDRDDEGQAVIAVRDNGVGFDMRYAGKLFGVFQRLHNDEQFEGTGIGLANVQRIVHRHGGRVWAEAAVDAGATFFVALPRAERSDP